MTCPDGLALADAMLRAGRPAPALCSALGQILPCFPTRTAAIPLPHHRRFMSTQNDHVTRQATPFLQHRTRHSSLQTAASWEMATLTTKSRIVLGPRSADPRQCRGSFLFSASTVASMRNSKLRGAEQGIPKSCIASALGQKLRSSKATQCVPISCVTPGASISGATFDSHDQRTTRSQLKSTKFSSTKFSSTKFSFAAAATSASAAASASASGAAFSIHDQRASKSQLQNTHISCAAFEAPQKHSKNQLKNTQISCTSTAASATSSDSDDQGTVTLLDYGAGNVRSIRNAIALLGYKIRDVTSPDDIASAKKLIFPGVGAFAAAMDVLNDRGYAPALKEYILSDRPFLGICIGMQMLFEASTEFGDQLGLGIIPGIVSQFDPKPGYPVPHMGWNGLNILQSQPSILDGLAGRHVYFVHSYRATPSAENEDWVLATADYGGPFVAAVRKGNVQGVQFHPEKSGLAGLDVIRRFLGSNLSQAADEVEAASHRAATQIHHRACQLAKRVVACLDVRANDRGDLVVTKGDQYDVREPEGGGEVRNLGKPVDLAERYFREGADEVAFLNITGFRDFPLGDLPMLEVMKRASERVFVPLTVGGGIRDFADKDGKRYSSLEVASEYFRSGADKISIGSEAVYAAEEFLRSGQKSGQTGIETISYVYGNQAVVVSIDPKRVYVHSPEDAPCRVVDASSPGPNGEKYVWYQCTVSGGREARPIGAYEVARAVEALGAGEILLNCIDKDGQGDGFELDLVRMVSDAVSIPVIASSGAGCPAHFVEVFKGTNASAALAAGIFHRQEVSILDVKEHLAEQGLETRQA